MKKIVILIMGMLFMAILITGCSSKTYNIKDVVELKDELPTRIIVHFDDPSFEPRSIETKDDITLIVGKLTEQKYKRIKTNSPAPLGNTSFELHYSDGSKFEFGARYITGTDGNIYQAESNDLTSLLESYRP